MKMKFGAIVVDGRGKIGGHVASKNRAGAYLRTKVTPVNPNTVAQQAVRAILSSLATSWAELTDAQRLGWNEAVADFASTDIFGDTKNPSGFNLYVKLNSNLLNSGQVQIDDAPAKLEVPFAELDSALGEVSPAELVINTVGNNYDGAVVVFSASGIVSAGITNVKSRMRNIGVSTFTAGAVDIIALYEAKFGALVAGGNLTIGVEVVLANGQKSVKQTIKATIIA